MDYTIKDVARIAGVSVATASMAVNNKPGPKEETRRHVLDVASRLNYTPNASARSLIKKRSGILGLVVTDITNPFFGMLADEINNSALKAGYSLSICLSSDFPDREDLAVRRLMQDRAEGIIIVPSARVLEKQPEYISSLEASSIPFIFCTTAYDNVDAPCVMCDLEKGSYLITKHLLTHGHKNIFMLTGAANTLFSSVRIDGCAKAHAELEMSFPSSRVIESYPDFRGGYDSTALALPFSPDAIITVNDQMALGVIKRLTELGITPGKDISVAGFDDTLYASLLETPLTTVRQPISELAEKTVAALLEYISSGYFDNNRLLVEPILKLRGSTKNNYT